MKKSFLACLFIIAFINVHGQSPYFKWAKSITPYFDTLSFRQIKSNSMDQDDLGNVYVVGSFNGKTDINPGAGINYVMPGASGTYDMYIAKYDSLGNFIWVKTISSNFATGDVIGQRIHLDRNNNIVIVGLFSRTTDFDPSMGMFTLAPPVSGDFQSFVLKLNIQGNFLWAKQLGSASSSENAYSVTSDVQNNIYSTGVFNGLSDADPGTPVFNLYPVNGINMYISKLDSNGNFIWAKSVGASGVTSPNVHGFDIEFDNASRLVISGMFQGSADFDMGSSTFNLVSLNSKNAFVMKMDVSGNFEWAKSFNFNQTSDNAKANDAVIDNNGNIYITGYYGTAFASDSLDIDPGPNVVKVAANKGSYFVLKLNNAGNLVWAETMGGLGSYGNAIALDANNNVYTIGNMNSTMADFDPSDSVSNAITTEDSTGYPFDIFIHKLSSNGEFEWVRTIDGPYNEKGTSILVDKQNAILASGHFGADLTVATIWNIPDTIDCDPTSSTFNLISGNWADVFILKWTQDSLATPNVIQSQNSLSNVKVYPNPNSGHFYLELNAESLVQLHDMQGRCVFQEIQSKGLQLVDVNFLADGIYMLSLSEKGQRKTIRITISQ